MIVDSLLLATLIVGHACLVILLVNWVHALGPQGRGLDILAYLLLLSIPTAAIGLAWGLLGEPWADWPALLRWYSVVAVPTAAIGLPLTTLWIRLRPLPKGVRLRSESAIAIDPARERGWIGQGRFAPMLKFPGNVQFRPIVREWEISRPDLPEALDGLRILHLTDLHFARCFERDFFDLIAEEAAAEEADLVLFTGDLIDDTESLAWTVPVLGRLRGRLGNFAILGNHDYGHAPAETVHVALEAAGYTTLDGMWTTIAADGATISLGGDSAPWGPRPAFSARPAADWSILLSHTPDEFYRAARGEIDLVFCGHNHGGQYRLPIVGPVLMPSRYSRRFDRGFFRLGRTLMYVSQGIAGKHPLRINSPPEITRLTLRCGKSSPHSATVVADQSRPV